MESEMLLFKIVVIVNLFGNKCSDRQSISVLADTEISLLMRAQKRESSRSITWYLLFQTKYTHDITVQKQWTFVGTMV